MIQMFSNGKKYREINAYNKVATTDCKYVQNIKRSFKCFFLKKTEI